MLSCTAVIFAQEDSPQVLYGRYCASCHGELGNGFGRGARHVFPRPRNFLRGTMRFASTANRVSSREDIKRVIAQGIPGSSMKSFSKLGDEALDKLSEQVLAFRKLGVTQSYIQQVMDDELPLDASPQARKQLRQELLDSDVLKAILRGRTEPGDRISFKTGTKVDAQTIDNGRTLYMKLNCQHCHGKEGRGVLGLDLIDDEQRPIYPRDLVADELKGGKGLEEVARRIRLGIPGTPMPSNPFLSEGQIISLAAYVRSLGKDPKRHLTNYQRHMLAIGIPLSQTTPKRPQKPSK